MKAFISGTLAAILIAVGASYLLEAEQTSATQAFTAYSADPRE